MTSAVDTGPSRDEQFGETFGGRMQSLLLALLLLGLGLAVAATGEGGPWWRPVLLVGAGAGTVAVLHWIRIRRLRQRAAARIGAARAKKQEAEEALDAATDRIEKLDEMSAAKSQFFSEISHAFRRPLTLTLGPIDTLLEGQHGALSEEARTQLRVAQRNGARLLWLVNQLSDLAEVETGSMVLAPTEDNLPAFVARSLRSFEDLAERQNVTLEFESTLDDPAARFDPSKMETILANLLSSAFRAAEEGASIQVVVRPAPVPEEDEGEAKGDESSPDLELFVEYVGADVLSGAGAVPVDWSSAGASDQEPGSVSTSVGLRLVGELADLHGGHFRVDRSGRDTVRFAVRLPRRPSGTPDVGREEGGDRAGDDSDAQLLDPESQSALALSRKALSGEFRAGATGGQSTAPLPSPDPTSRGPLPGEEALPGRSSRTGNGAGPEREDTEDRTTVLVIDDNPTICSLVRTHLEPTYQVEEAHNGAEGYNLARSLLPDLVITDVMMPEVDGFELCQKIKEDPDVDHVPVVFLTARANLEDRVEGFDTGADAYLTKPFEPEALIARVESLIANRRTLRETFRAEEGTGPNRGQAAEDLGAKIDELENAEGALPPTAEPYSLEEQIEATIAEHLTDPEFDVSDLASATALSASQLRRRMKEIYDRTPVQLIRRRRLEAGARLLREREDATIGEVAYAVGFNSQSYFSRSFRKEFGTSPSQYRNERATG